MGVLGTLFSAVRLLPALRAALAAAAAAGENGIAKVGCSGTKTNHQRSNNIHPPPKKMPLSSDMIFRVSNPYQTYRSRKGGGEGGGEATAPITESGPAALVSKQSKGRY